MRRKHLVGSEEEGVVWRRELERWWNMRVDCRVGKGRLWWRPGRFRTEERRGRVGRQQTEGLLGLGGCLDRMNWERRFFWTDPGVEECRLGVSAREDTILWFVKRLGLRGELQELVSKW